MIPAETIKHTVSIEDIIGQVVPLKRHGSWYRGRCPFHDDRNPSLVVWPRTGTWKCMTCMPMRDDVIGFVMRWQGISLTEALAWLTDYSLPAHPGHRPGPSSVALPTPIASLTDRDRVYRRLLAHWGLSSEHRQALRQRGLPDRVWAQWGFASAQGGVAPFDPGCSGVPGWFRKADHWELVDTSGLVIPVRTLDGSIEALHIRRDQVASDKYRWFSSANRPGGASSGAPVHVARGVDDVVWVTEGPLKAIIAQHYLHHTVLGIPGLNTWQAVPDLITALHPRRVLLAFDQETDPTKHALVEQQTQRLGQQLAQAGWSVWVAHWSGQKGLDDALVANTPITWKPLMTPP